MSSVLVERTQLISAPGSIGLRPDGIPTIVHLVNVAIHEMKLLGHSPITLMVVGTIVVIANVIAATYFQYRAAEMQNKVAEAKLMPQVEVRSILEKQASDEFTDRRLEISSDGGPVYAFAVTRRTWFEVKKPGGTTYEQPLSGYFILSVPTGRLNGSVETITGFRNNEKFGQFEKRARELLAPGYLISDPTSLLRISYRDSLHKPYLAYFLVNGSSVRRLEIAEGEARWQRAQQNESMRHSIDLDDLAKESAVSNWVRQVIDHSAKMT